MLNKNRTSLRVLDAKQRDEYSKQLMMHIADNTNCEMSIEPHNDYTICLLSGADSDSIMDVFNKSLISQLNLYIEKVLKTDPTYYNRSLILFESEVGDNHVSVKWST